MCPIFNLASFTFKHEFKRGNPLISPRNGQNAIFSNNEIYSKLIYSISLQVWLCIIRSQSHWFYPFFKAYCRVPPRIGLRGFSGILDTKMEGLIWVVFPQCKLSLTFKKLNLDYIRLQPRVNRDNIYLKKTCIHNLAHLQVVNMSDMKQLWVVLCWE